MIKRIIFLVAVLILFLPFNFASADFDYSALGKSYCCTDQPDAQLDQCLAGPDEIAKIDCLSDYDCDDGACAANAPGCGSCGPDQVCDPDSGICEDQAVVGGFEPMVLEECSAVKRCQTGNYCVNGKCTKQRANGDKCVDKSECVSGYCTETKICAAKSGSGANKDEDAKKAIQSAITKIDSFSKLATSYSELSLSVIVGKMITTLLGIIGTLALVIFIYNGIMWMFAHGNKQTVDKAQKGFIWAALGLVIIFSSYMIVRFVITALDFGTI